MKTLILVRIKRISRKSKPWKNPSEHLATPLGAHHLLHHFCQWQELSPFPYHTGTKTQIKLHRGWWGKRCIPSWLVLVNTSQRAEEVAEITWLPAHCPVWSTGVWAAPLSMGWPPLPDEVSIPYTGWWIGNLMLGYCQNEVIQISWVRIMEFWHLHFNNSSPLPSMFHMCRWFWHMLLNAFLWM